VEVTLDSPNDRLRIGMTASATFILASAKDTLAVPTAAIQTDDAGNSYVNVADTTGSPETGTEAAAQVSTEGMAQAEGTDTGVTQSLTFKERLTAFLNRITGKQTAEEAMEPVVYPTTQIPVTTGISDDYYTQITSGDIKEGDMVEEQGSGSSGDTSDLLEGLYADG
jgi:multidrug efflux pump subunit AcrA (membrane-fusion protein)